MRSRRSTRRCSAGRGTAGWSGSRPSTASPTVGNSDSHEARGDRDRLDDVPGPRRRPTCGRRSRRAGPTTTARSTGRAASSRRSGGSSGSTAATPGTASAAGSAATARVATSAIRAAATVRRGSTRSGSAERQSRRRGGQSGPMKIGLVSPYVYPLPGGVTQHVRYLYENLRLRGHDVRILTSSHGLQRASEGDIIRIGKGFSMPVNGSVGTITLSPRFVSQVRDMLEREQFDLLHFHEPFVPFLSPIILRALDERERRDLPRLRRLLAVVRVRQQGDEGRGGPAARADRRQRRREALHRSLLPGRVQGHPERRRRRPVPAGRPARALAGRHPEHPLRRPVRAAQGPPGAAQGVPHPAQDRLRLPAPRRRQRARSAGRPAATSRRAG